MDRTEQLGIRVSHGFKEKLQVVSKAEDRSLASLVELALREWLTSNNLMDVKIDKGQARTSTHKNEHDKLTAQLKD